MSFFVEGQNVNLVQNGSFESLEGKLKSLGCIENAVGWTSPTGVRADVFTPSKTLDINVPENIYGKEEAKEGKNYAGIVAFSYGDAIPRSYLMTKLTTPLKKGAKYCVKFNLSLAETSKYASNQIGVNFASKPFGTDAKTALIDKTHVLDSKNKIFSGLYNWEQVCGTYYAEGGEKFLTIGNFTSNENTRSEKNKKDPKMKNAQITAAYYYIDEVTVTMVVEDAVCECEGVQNDDSNYSNTIYQKVINTNDKMSVKEKIELQTQYFGFGKRKLTPSSIASLDLIASLLIENPSLKLEIFGHSDEMEEKLSKEKPQFVEIANRRVDEVIKYLISKGISESRLIGTPIGNNEPSTEISDGDDDDLKLAKNRRVSFKVR
jgi:outer membrane protein OmpA-like peptidoglycan-associated protein